MDLDRIRALIALFEASPGLSAFEVTENETRLKLVRRDGAPEQASAAPRAPAAPPKAPPKAMPPKPDKSGIAAPLPGMLYRGPEPGAPPFVEPGQAVTAGQVVCVIEAMKMLHAVEAPRAGTIAAILIADATIVEHGQTLMTYQD
jgi:acetyl-CoA carboxylase biotin carboxyl carrier protein